MRWRVGLYHLLLTALLGGFAALTVLCGRGTIEMPPPIGQPYAATEGAQEAQTEETVQEAMRVVSPKTGDSMAAPENLAMGSCAVYLATPAICRFLFGRIGRKKRKWNCPPL